MKGWCFCCHKESPDCSEMTDGVWSSTVCDECRQLVTPFFLIYRDLMTAVLEVAQAKRGSQK